MNNQADQPDSLDELPGDLRTAVQHLKGRPVPKAAMQRAINRAERCGSPRRWTDQRSTIQAAWGIVAAAVVCVAFSLWLARPSDLWAQVVDAVQAKPWVHGTVRGAQPGQSREFWISTSRATGGSKSAEQITFFDERLRIIYRYEPQKKILYRLPASTADLAQSQQFLETLGGLFRGDAEVKAGFSGMILKDQKRRQTEKDGRKWDEYELHFQIPSRPDADVRETFIVDTQTRLPQSMTMNNGGGESIEFHFDYPEQGPVDIYALGVPKDATVVDRVPTGDMSRILAAVQAGRERFDDFHAIVVRDESPDSVSGPGLEIPMVYLVWKKGNRWRVEIGVGGELTKPRPPNKDQREWVREACKKIYFRPKDVCNGKAVYEKDNFAFVTTPDQADTMCADAMRAMPTTWSYPITFPTPNDRTEEVVDLKPSAGPPNTILVTSRLLQPRGNEIPWQQFWLDPLRGHGVVRRDLRNTDPATPPTNRDYQDLMDNWEQTPNGAWYPTRVNAGSQNRTTWFHFYLDFPADMPDELFKPAKRTVRTEQYPVDG